MLKHFLPLPMFSKLNLANGAQKKWDKYCNAGNPQDDILESRWYKKKCQKSLGKDIKIPDETQKSTIYSLMQRESLEKTAKKIPSNIFCM